MSVCVSVCLYTSISPELHGRYSPVFVHVACDGPRAAAFRYVTHFRFRRCVTVAHVPYVRRHVDAVEASDVTASCAGQRPISVVLVASASVK